MFAVKSALFCALAYAAVAFAPPTAAPRRCRSPRTTVHMGFMDGLNKAFANEVIDTPPKGGLSKAAAKGIPVDICGAKIQAIKGQKLKDLVRASRAPIRFNCERGDCGSCVSMVNGKKVPVCRMSVTGPTTVKALR